MRIVFNLHPRKRLPSGHRMSPPCANRPHSRLVRAAIPVFVLAMTAAPRAGGEPMERDIVIYGGTSAGIVAGIQALAMGKTAVVIEPSAREGGLSAGGLGQTDIGNKQVIGGLAREFYRRIARHYGDPAAWTRQSAEEYRAGGRRAVAGEDAMWTFEPSVALKVFRDWIAESGLDLIRQERLDRESGVIKRDGRILSIRMESGREFRGRIFIDATYEGDLMAAAGISYTVGREANAQYGETLNGVVTRLDLPGLGHHQFLVGVDSYVRPGDPASGLLPFIDPEGPGIEGEGDGRVQAYNFRMCLTDDPANRVSFAKPEGYDEQWYELLFRNFEAGASGAPAPKPDCIRSSGALRIPWINSPMPNRKTDTNNQGAVSTDFIGQNYRYPEAGYAERDEIVARHRLWQQGLMWTLANHPRVPDPIRSEVARWGLARDEFEENDHWPTQIYVREARRMAGALVMTQHHCQGSEKASDPVGMGAYTMDSHHVQRYVNETGEVRNEGDIQVGGFPPYPIGYGAIVPREEECANLLAPVCLSASHIAFGSIRMEPVFMVLGQSAATAAALALDDGAAVQRVDSGKLRARLEADGQILDYQPPPPLPSLHLGLESIGGIVVDDTAAQLDGAWQSGGLGTGVHRGYRHDGNARDGKAVAVFTAELPAPGLYEVQIAWVANPNRASRVPVTVVHRDGRTESILNQREKPPIDGLFRSLGRYRFDASGSVAVSNAAADGYVIIDAVRWLPAE